MNNKQAGPTTMLGIALRTGVLLSVVVACVRPSDVEPLPELQQSQPVCHDWAQREQVCQELGEARLVLGDRNVSLTLDECNPNSYGAIVRWHRADGEPFDYHGVVRFDWQRQRKRLTPVEVAPLQHEWPARELGLDAGARVAVPVGAPCGGPSDEHRWIELSLPGPSESACVAGPWLRGSLERWCTQKLTVASEVYTVRDFGWRRGRNMWRVAVAQNKVSISRGNDRKTITDPSTLAQVTAQLSDLWTLERLRREGCRDGGETVIEALRNTGEWRSIKRSCTDPAGILRMLEALSPNRTRKNASSKQ